MRGKLAAAYIVGVSAAALCSSAYAADLRRPPPPMMMPAIPMWTGFYFGGHFGGVATQENATDFVGNSVSPDPNGVLGGIQAGYNYQVAPNWLIGIEGELSWTNANGTSDVFHSQHNWYDTLDGRVGYVIGSWLGYV